MSTRQAPALSTALAFSLAVVLLHVGVTAPPARAEPSPPPLREEPALALLERAAQASRTVAYRGTQFISTWSPDGTTTLVTDVAHIPGRGTAVQVEGTPGSSGGSVFAPEGAPVVGLAGPTGTTLSLLARHYDVALAGSGRVAGRDTHVVEALRPDRSVAARFWLDTRTGLVLRRQVLDERGRTVRASAYLEVDLGRQQAAMTHLPPVLPQPWTTEVSHHDLARLRTSGWSCPEGLPGRLTLYDARSQHARGHGRVLHLSYSDGLSTVSVFQQAGRLDTPPEGFRAVVVGHATVYVREGAPRRVVWSAGGTVYTVLAEAPWDTVEAVVASLPHAREDPGALDRVRRGLGRVVSWLNPFS